MHTNITSGPLFNWTQAIYALHAFSLLTGIIGTATVVGPVLPGRPSIGGVMLNYGLLVTWLPIALIGLWFVYRIVRGWVTLGERQPMYV